MKIKKESKMKLDSVTVVPFPDSAAFGAMYEKFFGLLVNSLNHAYSFADREDAVEEAFYKLTLPHYVRQRICDQALRRTPPPQVRPSLFRTRPQERGLHLIHVRRVTGLWNMI